MNGVTNDVEMALEHLAILFGHDAEAAFVFIGEGHDRTTESLFIACAGAEDHSLRTDFAHSLSFFRRLISTTHQPTGFDIGTITIVRRDNVASHLHSGV